MLFRLLRLLGKADDVAVRAIGALLDDVVADLDQAAIRGIDLPRTVTIHAGNFVACHDTVLGACLETVSFVDESIDVAAPQREGIHVVDVYRMRPSCFSQTGDLGVFDQDLGTFLAATEDTLLPIVKIGIAYHQAYALRADS